MFIKERKAGRRIGGKRIIGDDNPEHYYNAHHHHVHDLDSERPGCEIDQIVAHRHVRTFNPDTLEQAKREGYVPCSWCLGGPLCRF